MNSNDTQYWKTLEERYFAGTATDEEERRLLQFAATTSDPAFRPLQAVLGFVCAERRQFQIDRRRRRMTVMRYAAAAVVLVAVGATALFRTISIAPLTAASEDGLVAYVGGQRVTDEAQIIALMNSTLDAMGDDTDLAEQQLRDMLETLE